MAPSTTPATPPSSSPTTLAPSGLVLDGRGYGHGVGLSQWGALGHALDGESWQGILAHYYGGTVLSKSTAQDFSPLAAGSVTVRLQSLDDRQTAITQAGGLARFSADPVPSRTWSAIVVRELPGQTNLYRVWARATAACPAATDPLSAPWTLVADRVAGPITISTPNGSTPSAVVPDDLLGVCEPDADVVYYRGTVEAVTGTTGEHRTVNVVPIELFLRSVVASEMAGSWGSAGGGAGMNALRSQAVAARTYALSESSSLFPGLKYSYAKTCDTSCVAYRGAAIRTGGGSGPARVYEDPRATAAVGDTTGVILRDPDGRASRAYYSASNGGRTASGPFPVADDPEDGVSGNTNYTWRVTIPTTAIQAAWPKLGTFIRAVVIARDGTGGSWGGRTTSVQVIGTRGSTTVTGTQFRSALGLKSTWFQIEG
jgi:SpoIID/LytB domain protein